MFLAQSFLPVDGCTWPAPQPEVWPPPLYHLEGPVNIEKAIKIIHITHFEI